MKTNIKIYKYTKLSLFSNFIFLDNFACCKKGDKSRRKNGFSTKVVLDEYNNNNPTEQQSNENEKPDNPDDANNIEQKFIQKQNEFKTRLNDINTKNNYLPDNKITFDKPTLEDKIDKIKSDKEVDDINIELGSLESQLTKALNDLKQDYINRLKEIINGNNKLSLCITINLTEDTINNLDFNKDIKDIKTDLENLEKEYFENLKNKCKNLKTTYNNLKKEINGIKNEKQKKTAENLCILTDASFNNIKKYEAYEDLKDKITNIQLFINNNIDELKKQLQDKYKKFQEIATNLDLKIKNSNYPKILTIINSLTIDTFENVSNILDDINKEIKNEIFKLNNELKEEYYKIIEKIKYIDTTKKENKQFNYNIINLLTINNETTTEEYNNFKNNINTIKNKFEKELEKSKDSYKTKINDLNTKLEGLDLNSDKINLTGDNNILNNLTFDKLTKDTISNIESAINNASEKCNYTIETYKNECSSKLKAARETATNGNILNIKEINNLISNIESDIKNIKTTENKNKVDILIKDLTTKIKKENENENKDFISKLKRREGLIDKKYPGTHIHLDKEKLKLYYNEILIAESIESVNEADINKNDYHTKYKFNLNLKFRNRANFKIKTTLKNILINYKENINGELKNYYERTNNFLLKLNFTYNNGIYNNYYLYYDFNTGNILGTYNDSKGENILLGFSVYNGLINVNVGNAFNLTKNKYGSFNQKSKLLGFLKSNDFTFTENNNINEVTDYLTEKDLKLFNNFKLTNDNF